MKRTLSVVVLCWLALAACSTTVSGNGSLDPNAAASPSGGGSTSDGDNGGDDGDNGGGNGNDDGGDSDGSGGERQSLSCDGGTVISPDGAPYCYLLPSGLRKIDDIVLPGGGDFTSSVGIGGRDLIAVTVFRTPADTDELSNDELSTDTDKVVAEQLSDAFTFESTVGERLTVDGARTLHYKAKSKQESFNIDIYFVYRAKGKIQVNCQSQEHQTEIDAGCEQLLDSLQFIALH